MSQWKYMNDLRELHQRIATETDPKVIQEHTCPKCGDIAFKHEIEIYQMCWNDYEIAEAAMARKEASAMAGFRSDMGGTSC